jgi:hypothetical protein
MEKISKHISWKEATNSNTAVRRGIDNSPNAHQLKNMRALADYVFEPLRIWAGGPIKINSFFRSPELNKAIGGSTTSQHCADNGAAMDIDDDYGTKTNAEMFHYIKDNLDFDQLIWEFGDDNNPNWVHVSFKLDGVNRKQILKAVKKDGKTKYELWQ